LAPHSDPPALVVGHLDVAARQEHQQLVARRHGNGRTQVAALDIGRLEVQQAIQLAVKARRWRSCANARIDCRSRQSRVSADDGDRLPMAFLVGFPSGKLVLILFFVLWDSGHAGAWYQSGRYGMPQGDRLGIGASSTAVLGCTHRRRICR
jgi:hypothetical protein